MQEGGLGIKSLKTWKQNGNHETYMASIFRQSVHLDNMNPHNSPLSQVFLAFQHDSQGWHKP